MIKRALTRGFFIRVTRRRLLLPIHMSKFTEYLKDTKTELKHVIWPSRQHTMYATLLVIGLSILVGYYLGIFDYIFARILERVIGF